MIVEAYHPMEQVEHYKLLATTTLCCRKEGQILEDNGAYPLHA
jgi:hypothetical protein